MSVRRFFCMMMAVVLCLVMQLPLLVMPAAMAADDASMGVGPASMQHTPFHMMAMGHGMGRSAGHARGHVPGHPSGHTPLHSISRHMKGDASPAMVAMADQLHAPSWGMRLGSDAAPCCQSHHGLCDAGLLPAGPVPTLQQGSRLAYQHYALRLSLRSAVVPPWRPPAAMPV